MTPAAFGHIRDAPATREVGAGSQDWRRENVRGGKDLTVDISDWLRLRQLLSEAAQAAETADALEDARIDALRDEAAHPPTAPDNSSLASAEGGTFERERVVGLGVTGLIVRFPDDDPEVLRAISHIPGWRPNPSGSHHVPCTLPAIASLLAFAERYDFELTDGADSIVRQLIRDSYHSRERQEQTPAGATPNELRIPMPSAPAPVWAWLRENARALVIAVLLAYLLGPKIELVREADRAFLQAGPLGAGASVGTMLSALDRCGSATVAAGASLPAGCDASVATRSGTPRLSVGTQNPRLRLFSWRVGEEARGFAICDQAVTLEACWER